MCHVPHFRPVSLAYKHHYTDVSKSYEMKSWVDLVILLPYEQIDSDIGSKVSFGLLQFCSMMTLCFARVSWFLLMLKTVLLTCQIWEWFRI